MKKKYAVVGLVSAILVASSFASTFSIKTNELSDIQIWKMFQFENSWMSENEEVVQEETKKIEHPMYFWIENNKVAYDNYVKISKFKAGV